VAVAESKFVGILNKAMMVYFKYYRAREVDIILGGIWERTRDIPPQGNITNALFEVSCGWALIAEVNFI